MRQICIFLVVALAIFGAAKASETAFNRLTFTPTEPRSGGVPQANDLLTDHQQKPVKIDCPSGALVLLAVGQSNAANEGDGLTIADPQVVNFYDGHCYIARDPLLGATGAGASFLTRLDIGKPIIVVPLAVSGSRMAEWQSVLFDRITLAQRELEDVGLAVDATIVVQGETEGQRNRSGKSYQAAAIDFYQRLPGRVFVGLASRCGDDPPNEAIRSAQLAAAKAAGARIGPDIDTLDKQFHGCHLDDEALSGYAAMWSEVLSGL